MIEKERLIVNLRTAAISTLSNLVVGMIDFAPAVLTRCRERMIDGAWTLGSAGVELAVVYDMHEQPAEVAPVVIPPRALPHSDS